MKPFRERNPISVGLIGGAVMLVIGLAALYWEELPILSGTSYTAEFSEAAGLKADNEVRVGGVKVGKVTDVELAGDKVLVDFKVRGAWVGDTSTAAIKIKTLLGQKMLALEPSGTKELNPDKRIPLSRTTTPYDVNDAFGELSNVSRDTDTDQLAEAFGVLSDTLDASTPEDVSAALDGMANFAKTISNRDADLRKLLSNTHKISKTMAGQNENVAALITDGRTLLSAIAQRRAAISQLLDGTKRLSRQLTGVVDDNRAQLKPALKQLDRVATVLQRNRDKLDSSLRLAGPFYRVIGNAVGNGSWVDNYICGLVRDDAKGCKPPKPGGR